LQPVYVTVPESVWQHRLSQLRDRLPTRQQLIEGVARFVLMAIIVIAVLAAIKMAPLALAVAFIAVVLLATTGRSPEI
jgi:small-conductance mechanosensitive channel